MAVVSANICFIAGLVLGALLLGRLAAAESLECLQTADTTGMSSSQHQPSQLHGHSSDSDEFCSTDGACFIKVSKHSTHFGGVVSSGCVPKGDVPVICKGDHLTTGILCCYDNHCNGFMSKRRNLRSLENDESSTKPMDSEMTMKSNNKYKTEVIITAVICVVVTTIVIATFISGIVYWCCCRSNRQSRRRQDVESGRSNARVVGYHRHNNCCEALIPQGQSLASLLNISRRHNTSSLSTMVQRSIIRYTVLERRLDKNEKWEEFVGNWRRERVLVKIYQSEYEKVWFSETEINQLPHMSHDNILSFIAADVTHINGQPRHHLINVYHERGTLFEYLKQTVIDVPALLYLGSALCRGLAHLHAEVRDNQGTLVKPSIAHRNLTSQSVYVKNDGTCCIGDFSMAVKDEANLSIDLRGTPLGNPRYQAPEILDGSLTKVDICVLRRTDMYALSLVLWELTSRCSLQGVITEAALPYSDVVPSDMSPSVDEMKTIVCDQQHRPPVEDKWSTDETMSNVLTLITECWRSKSDDRPTSHHVNTQFNKLLNNSLHHRQSPPLVDKNGKVAKQPYDPPKKNFTSKLPHRD